MANPSRVLVVDDERVHRAFASSALSAAGWTVDEAADGAAAQAAIAQVRYAVVLLDIGLPDADGFAISRAIRADGGGDPTVPILAFTAMAGADLPARIAAAGMDDHIVKPIAAEALVARLAVYAPQPIGPVRARLVAAFGAAEIAALNDGFHTQLTDALQRIDTPDIAALAHRIAGIAGQLGFADVHRSWLALSEGEQGAAARAASDARRVLRLRASPR